MSSFDSLPATDEPVAEDLVEVGRYPTEIQATEHGLVILALGRPYWLLDTSNGFSLLTERDTAPTARAHLAAFDRESARWPPPPITDPWMPGKIDLISPLLWAAGVLGIFYFGRDSPSWADRGVLDSRLVFENHEWWRAVTALFLHADAAHVISNALSGLLVFTAVLATLGRLRGWLLLLIASVVGNLAVAGINYPGPYASLGASTAIFAGIGLLSGRSIRIGWRSTHPHRWRAMFIPLATGLTVLALYGAGGQRVDVGAHLTGFVAGVGIGFAAALGRNDSIGRQ